MDGDQGNSTGTITGIDPKFLCNWLSPYDYELEFGNPPEWEDVNSSSYQSSPSADFLDFASSFHTHSTQPPPPHPPPPLSLPDFTLDQQQNEFPNSCINTSRFDLHHFHHFAN